MKGSSATIADCTFTNLAGYEVTLGTAIRFEEAEEGVLRTLSVVNCLFQNISNPYQGGRKCRFEISRLLLHLPFKFSQYSFFHSGALAVNGGAITIIDAVFKDLTAIQGGGRKYTWERSFRRTVYIIDIALGNRAFFFFFFGNW